MTMNLGGYLAYLSLHFFDFLNLGQNLLLGFLQIQHIVSFAFTWLILALDLGNLLLNQRAGLSQGGRAFLVQLLHQIGQPDLVVQLGQSASILIGQLSMNFKSFFC